jgi:hypothetical protein
LFKFKILFKYEFYSNSKSVQNLKNFKSQKKEKEKTNKKKTATGSARQEAPAGGATLAPANAQRLGAPQGHGCSLAPSGVCERALDDKRPLSS